MEQYVRARDAVWAGAQKRANLDSFKSVYSIFVSRVDQYTAKHSTSLAADSQGQVGIVNAKQIWAANQAFWKANQTPLRQEIIFASTGTKDPADPPTKYVAALAGSDIQTNPPATNEAVSESGLTFSPEVANPIPAALAEDIAANVDMQHLHDTLMGEGIAKFASPQKQLIATIAKKRASSNTAS
jgi:transaldolase